MIKQDSAVYICLCVYTHIYKRNLWLLIVGKLALLLSSITMFKVWNEYFLLSGK